MTIVEMARKGGLARAANLSKKQKRRAAKVAAKARWSKAR